MKRLPYLMAAAAVGGSAPASAPAPGPDVSALQKENAELKAALAAKDSADKSVVALVNAGLTEKQARKVPQHKAAFAALRAQQKKAAKA